jgi:hypothetical protein
LDDSSSAFDARFFDACYYEKAPTVRAFEQLLRKERPLVVHLYSPYFDEMCELVERQSFIPFVFDYKDVFRATHDFGADGNRRSASQMRLIFKANGLIYRDYQAAHLAKLLTVKLPRHSVFLPDLCWSPEFLPYGTPDPSSVSECDGPSGKELGRRVVITGNYAIEKLWPNREGIGLLRAISKLIDEGFRVDYFPSPHGLSDFSDYLRFSVASDGRFRLKEKVPPDELMTQLRAYEFAFVPCQYRLFPRERLPINFDPIHLDLGGAARFTEYVGAGLPILFSQARFQSALNKVYGFGVELVPSDSSRLIDERVLAKLPACRSNCERIRGGAFNIDAHVTRLISLYRALAG